MASITPTILQNNQRQDGTWLVVYRLTHKRKSVYIKTSHVITKSQLNKDSTIKQKFIIDYLSDDVKDIQNKINRLGLKTEKYTASQLKEILTSSNQDIDFIAYMDVFMVQIKPKVKETTYGTYTSVINHLKDFQNGKPLLVSDINSKYIKAFMAYVQQPKEIIRYVGRDKAQMTKRVTKITSSNSLYTIYFRFLKMFESCKDEYNDEDLSIIRIPHNPFAKVEVPMQKNTKKRALTVEEIRSIRDYQPTIWSEVVGKNIFMLSFLLCGINMVDVKNNVSSIGERLDYNRSKVENKRKDSGFISINIPKIAKPYIEWYLSVKENWSNSKNLTATTNIGLRRIAKKLEITDDLTTYYARHSFATIARNDCGVHKEDIAMALNHTGVTRITDIYIKTDWSIIDRVQDAVINKINEDFK